jgi:hypothetical protein
MKPVRNLQRSPVPNTAHSYCWSALTCTAYGTRRS